MNGIQRKVVGVLPPDFRFLSSEARIIKPSPTRPEQRAARQRYSGGGAIRMIARLKPSVTIAQAQSQIDAHNAAVEKGIAAPEGEEKSERAAGHHNERALDEQLTDNPAAARIEPSRDPFIWTRVWESDTPGLNPPPAVEHGMNRARAPGIATGAGPPTRSSSSLKARPSYGASPITGKTLVALRPRGVKRFAAITFDARVLGFGFLAAAATTVLFGLWPAWNASRSWRKLQGPSSNRSRLIGTWLLGFLWSLDVGIWDFRSPMPRDQRLQLRRLQSKILLMMMR